MTMMVITRLVAAAMVIVLLDWIFTHKHFDTHCGHGTFHRSRSEWISILDHWWGNQCGVGVLMGGLKPWFVANLFLKGSRHIQPSATSWGSWPNQLHLFLLALAVVLVGMPSQTQTRPCGHSSSPGLPGCAELESESCDILESELHPKEINLQPVSPGAIQWPCSSPQIVQLRDSLWGSGIWTWDHWSHACRPSQASRRKGWGWSPPKSLGCHPIWFWPTRLQSKFLEAAPLPGIALIPEHHWETWHRTCSNQHELII